MAEMTQQVLVVEFDNYIPLNLKTGNNLLQLYFSKQKPPFFIHPMFTGWDQSRRNVSKTCQVFDSNEEGPVVNNLEYPS